MKPLKKHFPKGDFYKQIVEFGNNLFIFEIASGLIFVDQLPS